MGYFTNKLSTPFSSGDVSPAGEKKNAEAKIEVQRELESLSSDEKGLDHIFQDPEIAKYYEGVYESTNYECRDWIDHNFTWTQKEETKLRWKIDWYVTFWAFVMFSALDIDRYNLAQALSDNLLEDLKLTTNDYNLGNTVNLVCFLASELPSQLLSKWIGPDVWIPMQMVLWSVVSMSQAAMKNRTGFLVTRAFVGLLQGGFIPDVCLWMSYFYTSDELPSRFAWFYIANPLLSVWLSLLAFALLKIKTHAVGEGWRWLFIVEGLATLLVGIMSFFKMPASAVQTKTWYRKKGWFSDREEKIIVNRVLRDDPAKGDMNNRQPVGPRELLGALLNYDMWPIYAIRMLGDIGSSPALRYMTLTLRHLGFSTFKTNALTIPYNIITIISMMSLTYISEFFNQRALALAITPIWNLAGLMPLRWWKGSQIDVWGTYAILTVMLGHPPTWAISISWCSANSNSVRSRVVSAALVNMFSQAGSVCAAYIYRPDDAPLYHRGNMQLIAIGFATLAMCIIAKVYYVFRNYQKKKLWDAMTPEEQKEYIATTTDESSRRLDFKFVS